MKILLLTQFFSTTKGGGETVFNILAKSLADSGNSVSIITSKIKDEIYPSHKNIKYIFVPPLLEHKGGQPPSFENNVVYCLGAILKGLSIIIREKIDIIHSNNFAPSFAGSIISTLTLKPHIMVIHDVLCLEKGFWKEWGRQKDVSKLNVLLGPSFEKLIIKLKSVAIHTVSEATKNDLFKLGVKKPIYLIPNAIKINELKIEEALPFQFIYIGRLIFYKNLEVVIKAIGILKRSYPKVSLIIVGGGPHKEKLERLVNDLCLQDNIKFKGHLTEEEKNRFLSTSQAMVFPSLVEGFGLVILEGYAFAKPILVSNIQPMSKIVYDKITGFVISPHNENEWAKSMEQIIKQPLKARVMGLAGRETLEKKYSIQCMHDKLMKMYRDIIKE